MSEELTLMSEIVSIVYQPQDEEYGERIGDFIRLPLQEATLLADHGIAGDRKAGRNPNRQLNILSFEWLEELRPLGYQVAPGSFGEQLIVRGLPLLSLQAGDRLLMGSEALVEITKPRTGCIRLEAAQGQSNAAFDGEVGMMAKVVSGGVIRVGDQVQQL